MDDIVAAGHRRRRRVLTWRIGGAGVAAVALATSGLLAANAIMLSDVRPVTHPDIAAGPPAAPAVATAPLTFMFAPYRAGAIRVLLPQEATTTYQTASIVTDYKDSTGRTTTAYVGTLTVYRPGVRPPAIFTSGTKVTVNGLPGFANEREQDSVTEVNGGGVFANPVSAMANTLAWQYAANSWAVINSIIDNPNDISRRLTAADEQALADAFRLGTPSRARIPFQVGHLPTGWELVSVSGRSFSAEDIASVTVIFAPSSSAAPDKVRHFANATDGPAVVITIIHDQAPPPDAPASKSTCGHLETATDLYCSWAIPHTRYGIVMHDPASTLSSTELIRIGQGLTFADLDQPGTWHPAP